MSGALRVSRRTRSEPSSGNVFADLGFHEPEARVLQMRAMLQIQIEAEIQARGWTRLRVSKQLGVDRAQATKIMTGLWPRFGLDRLVEIATRAGLRPALELC